MTDTYPSVKTAFAHRFHHVLQSRLFVRSDSAGFQREIGIFHGSLVLHLARLQPAQHGPEEDAGTALRRAEISGEISIVDIDVFGESRF